MSIVQRVAIGAHSRELDRADHRLLMTRQTVGTRMRAVQGERRFGIVVEPPALPAVRIVTRRAVAPQAPLMDIVCRMTTGAIGLGVSEGVTCVTLLARHRTVQAQQREARELMIEGDLLGPARFHMTTVATLFQLSFVHIVLRVT